MQFKLPFRTDHYTVELCLSELTFNGHSSLLPSGQFEQHCYTCAGIEYQCTMNCDWFFLNNTNVIISQFVAANIIKCNVKHTHQTIKNIQILDFVRNLWVFIFTSCLQIIYDLMYKDCTVGKFPFVDGQPSIIKLEGQLFRTGRRISPKFCTHVRI